MKYKLEISGYRALAISSVILYHLSNNLLPNGYLGVDIFFVISGYLIGGHIHSSIEKNTFSLGRFWKRRFMRIIPASSTMIFITAGYHYFYEFLPEFQIKAEAGFYSLLSLVNIYFWKYNQGYWSTSSELFPYLHMWSLSLEEQFYFCLPIYIFLIFKFKYNALLLTISLSIFSFILFYSLSSYYELASFYLLFFRGWELLIGYIVYLFKRIIKCHIGYRKLLFEFWGLSFIIFSFFCEIDSLPLNVFAVLGISFLIISISSQRSLLKTLFSMPLFNIVGKLSYSLYLWHWPLISIVANYFSKKSFQYFIIYFAILFATSTLSYLIVERYLRYKIKYFYHSLFVFFSFIYLLYLGQKYNHKHNTLFLNKPNWHVIDCYPHPVSEKIGVFSGTNYMNYVIDRNAFAKDGFMNFDNNQTNKIIMMGDSHGVMWSKVILEIANDLNESISFFTMGSGESPFFSFDKPNNKFSYLTYEERSMFNRSRYRALSDSIPNLVILSARWNQQHLVDCNELMAFLANHDIPTLLIESPPCLKIGNKNMSQFIAWKNQIDHNVELECYDFDELENGRGIVRKIANKYSNTEIANVYDLFLTSPNSVLAVDDNKILYLDDDHLTYEGCLVAKDLLFERISYILKK